jgi:hypothetical protein
MAGCKRNDETCLKFFPTRNILRSLRVLTLIAASYSFFLPMQAVGQVGKAGNSSFFSVADSLNRNRLYALGIAGTTTYAAASYSLYNVWYLDYPQAKFHLFDDWGLWEHVDKVGHAYTTYMQSYLVFRMARWTGMEHRPAILTGTFAGLVFQSTIEVMDGFSEGWGFSLTDMWANLAGSIVFAGQEYLWQEQRVFLKYGTALKDYSNLRMAGGTGNPVQGPIEERAQELYGSNLPTRILKDYNASTTWLSVHPGSFFPDSGWPAWLNLAFGYSAENLFGARDNTWVKEGMRYDAGGKYPRYHQFLIAPDINWAGIRTNSAFLAGLFHALNVLKAPTPALEINDLDGIRFVFHWMYF